uniref:Uncharacterized protein n=1 Tax=Anguilla anguilla TaxID=7936 RepID=A0A0E9RPB9_ANGAN
MLDFYLKNIINNNASASQICFSSLALCIFTKFMHLSLLFVFLKCVQDISG